MIKCLENIPEKWKVGRVKDIFYISKDKAHQKDPVILSLARDGIKVRDISNNEGQIAESYENYNPVKPGDLLLNPMDLYSGANCNMSLVEGVISPAYVNLRKKYKDISPKFYDYYFKVQYWTMNMFAHGKGVSFDNRWTLNTEGVLNFEIPILSGEEQQRIADFLDKKCSQIERLIKLQENEIEKLKEYKSQFVLETICKGIDTKEFQETGIDWIGEMPKHWYLNKIKYATKISRGLFNHRPRNDERLYDGKYPFIQTGDVARATKYITTYSQTLNDFGKSVSKEFKKGTLTMTIAANVGDVSILDFDAYFPDSVVGFTPLHDNSSEYLYYIFLAMKNEFIRASIVSTQLNLNIERIKDMKIPFTDNKEEQKRIVEFLNNKCEVVDSLIQKKNDKIKMLQEYKKSLIYECVTGKKEI